jgi:selenocysteine lyase/cysteine desulfurase
MSSVLRTTFQGYHGFKAFLACWLFGIFLFAAIIIGVMHKPAALMITYTVQYWTASPVTFCGLLLLIAVFAMMFWFDVLIGPYSMVFRRTRRNQKLERFHEFGRLLAIGGLLLAITVIPFLNLHYPRLIFWTIQLFVFGSALLQYVSFLAPKVDPSGVKSKSQFQFNRKHFDVAALNAFSGGLDDEIIACEDRCVGGANSVETQRFLTEGDDRTSWKGIRSMFLLLGDFVSVNAERITLHDRTTVAIQFALEEILESCPEDQRHGKLILTTDCEYGSILNRLLGDIGLKYGASHKAVNVSQFVYLQSDPRQIADEIVSSLEITKADVLLLSHVCWGTGYRMPLELILSKMREKALRPRIVIDGAQALGHIEVRPSLLDDIDYYAGCAHKWLLTPPTLGILVRNDREVGKVVKKLRYPARPFSSISQEQTRTDVTISLNPYFALNALLTKDFCRLRQTAIEAHNRTLADRFRFELRSVNSVHGIAPSDTAVATIDFGPKTVTIFRKLQNSGFSCNLVQLPPGDKSMIRFCFHYFHSEYDVLELIEVIDRLGSEN